MYQRVAREKNEVWYALYPSDMIKKTLGAPLLLCLVSVLALTGCGASGQGAPTRNIKQVTDGVEAQSASIYLRDFVLVNQPDGSATLVATFINEEASADALTGITVAGIKATLTAPSFNLAQNAPLIFSGDSANARGSVPGLKATAGVRVPVVVSFAHAAPVTLSVLVRAKSDYFAGVGTKPTASATVTPVPSATPAATK